MAKIQNAVKTLLFKMPANTPPEAPTLSSGKVHHIDLSQCVSIVNRRFYRQGKNWVVAGFKVLTATGYLGVTTIAKLPETWAVSNSWHKTYAAWKKQQDHAMEEAGLESAIARYRDFKIHMDVVHQTAGFSANLIPEDLDGSVFATGEWDESQIVIPNDGGVAGNTVEYDLHMVGADVAASKAMIQNYADSRSTPQSPDPHTQNPEDSFFSEMIDLGEIQESVVDNAEERNNDLPYTQNNYPGGAVNAPGLQIVDTVGVNANTIHSQGSMRGDTFPCGLIKVGQGTLLGSDPIATDVGLVVYLVPGQDRGYMTQNMQDM